MQERFLFPAAQNRAQFLQARRNDISDRQEYIGHIFLVDGQPMFFHLVRRRTMKRHIPHGRVDVADFGRGQESGPPQSATSKIHLMPQDMADQPLETSAPKIRRRIVAGHCTATLLEHLLLRPEFLLNASVAQQLAETVRLSLGVRPVRVETAAELESQIGPNLVDCGREPRGMHGARILDDLQPAFVHHVLQEESGLVDSLRQEFLLEQALAPIEQRYAPPVKITSRKTIREQDEHAPHHVLPPKREARLQFFLVDPARTLSRRVAVVQDFRVGLKLHLAECVFAEEQLWRFTHVFRELKIAVVCGQILRPDFLLQIRFRGHPRSQIFETLYQNGRIRQRAVHRRERVPRLPIGERLAGNQRGKSGAIDVELETFRPYVRPPLAQVVVLLPLIEMQLVYSFDRRLRKLILFRDLVDKSRGFGDQFTLPFRPISKDPPVVFVEKSEVKDDLDVRIAGVVGFVPHLVEKCIGPLCLAHIPPLLVG